MGNFERLSVLVIVVVIVMILIVALVQLTNDPGDATAKEVATSSSSVPAPAPLDRSGTSSSGMSDVGVLLPTPLKGATDHPASPPVRTFLDKLTDGPTPPPAPGPIDPTPAPAPETPKAAEPKIHVVQPGETIQRIAKTYYPSAVAKATDAILKANPTVDAARMKVGTKLTIPALDAAAPGTPSGPAQFAIAPKPTPSSGVTPGGSYVVKQGDTLAIIAKRAYGTSERWHEIWTSNFQAVGDDVDHPRAGTHLNIPK
jgi:nucleoid-associated protein YgaU